MGRKTVRLPSGLAGSLVVVGVAGAGRVRAERRLKLARRASAAPVTQEPEPLTRVSLDAAHNAVVSARRVKVGLGRDRRPFVGARAQT